MKTEYRVVMELWYRTVRLRTLHSSDEDKVDLKRLVITRNVRGFVLAVLQKCCSYSKILRTGLIEVLIQPVKNCLCRVV